MASVPKIAATGKSSGENTPGDDHLFRGLALISGLLTTFSGILGFFGLVFGITVLASLFPGYKPIAFSAVVVWVFFGCVLAIHAVRPLEGIVRTSVAGIIATIAVAAAIEFPLNILGKHFIIETVFMRLGDLLAGQPTTPISPAAVGLIIPAATGLFLMLSVSKSPGKEPLVRNLAGLTGIMVALIGFTFVLSYLYGSPLLYTTTYIPIAFISALAAAFTGVGLVASAGPSATPVSFFLGPGTRARLLRVFVPLTVAIVFAHVLIETFFLSSGLVPDVVLDALVIMLFVIVTSYVVARVSSSVGLAIDLAEQKQRDAEEELREKHSELNAAYEQLTSGEEELRQNYEELNASQQELRTSEEKFRALFENLLDGYAYCRMLYDEEGRPSDFIYINVNPAFDRIIGVKTVTGKRVTEVFPGIRDAYTQLFEIYGRVALTGQPETFELEFRPAAKWLHISVYSHEKGFFVAIFEDITERRKAEAELAAARERFHELFENVSIGIIRTTPDPGGAIIEANPAALHIFDADSREQFLARSPRDLYLDQDQRQKVSDEILAREVINGMEIRFTTLKGRPIWGRITSAKKISGEGRIYFDNTIEDITDRKLIEHQRETLIHELEQKNSELERFTYTVSHDLKSPLITIKGFLGMLEEDSLKGDIPQLKSDVSRISAATDKMQALLTDLLTLSRIGRIANPPETVSFGVIAREAVEQVAGAISDKGVAVTIEPDLPEVYVDRVRIREVLVNLVENAIKFMGDQKNPAITIGIRTKGPMPEFFVQDNGIGIEPQYRKKIFGLFEKLDPKTEGTGVGLTIVQRIIEVHGGKIWVESAGPGTGSTFRFTLPDVP